MLTVLERALRYHRIHGIRQLFRLLLVSLREKFALIPGASVAASAALDNLTWVSAIELSRQQTQSCTPLRLYKVPFAQPKRISVVTDSISRGSLYGGVGTALLLGALVAQAHNRRLRIITRTEPGSASGLFAVLSTYGIALDHEVEFAFAPTQGKTYELDEFDDEWFITTSWWTTAATLGSVRPHAIWYLLQEDERMFYPHGDEHLRCANIMTETSLRYIVNTRQLFDHLVCSGLSHLTERGQWFEPSFPPRVFYPAASLVQGKRKLVFYARPQNLRNLFYFGIELLELALARGVLDLECWDIVLLGKDIPRLRFDQGRYSPVQIENLCWADYAALARQTDLALCLMYTPHPSYLPLDMVASGSVVVTNRYGSKQDLSHYSPNIITGEAEIESMLTALAAGLQLATDESARAANFQKNRLGQDWNTSFAEVLKSFGEPP